MAQRDSDANKDVQASRCNAWANFSNDSDATQETEIVHRDNAFTQFQTYEINIGSNLIQQFETPYLSRVFNVTLPW